MSFTVRVLYDPPDSPVQCSLEAVSSFSLTQARAVMGRMLESLKWDQEYCYSDDMPEMAPPDGE